MTDPYVRGVTVERLRCLEIIREYRAGLGLPCASDSSAADIDDALADLARLIENPEADDDGA